MRQAQFDSAMHKHYGDALAMEGKLDNAAQCYRQAIAIYPQDAQVHNKLGDIFYEQQALSDAEACYRRALEIKPNFTEARINLGLTLDEQGHLTEAEACYRHVVQTKPDDILAYFNLGVTLSSQGRFEDAQVCYRRVTEINPNFYQAHFNLGILLQQQGRLIEAEPIYRRTLEINPNHVDAHCNLGIILKEQGRFHEAEASLRRALEIKSDLIQAHFNLGVMLSQQERLVEAEICQRRVLEIRPDYIPARDALLNIIVAQDRFSEAEAIYRQMLEGAPDDFVMHSNLGVTLAGQGLMAEAEACYRRALEIKSDFADAQCNLGCILMEQGRLLEAEASCRKALELNSGCTTSYRNLGLLLYEQGRLSDAEVCYRRALEINPNLASVHSNLGNTLRVMHRLNEAETSYRLALQIKPDFTEAYNNLGIVLDDQGRNAEAEASYRHALELRPDYAEAYSNLLFVLNYHPDRSSTEIFAAYQEYDVRFAQPHQTEWRSFGNVPNPTRRLKIGYVSPDFRLHPVRHFLEPLLAQHDKQLVEVYAYAELSVEDAVTARYKTYVEHWIPTSCLSDPALAERIRKDGIDILVDLAGHTGRNRLQVFARKPAPVSLSWLGFGYTTGLTAVDYLLIDEASAPAGSEAWFSEQPWRLATPGYVYRPAEGMGPVNVLPAIARAYVTFGTLTRAVRINHHTIRVWSEILKRVKGAKLVIDSGSFQDSSVRHALAEKFSAHGIESARLEIGRHTPPWDVLRGIDIGLDCFPHNSGTTLFETLYMGIPYVTLAGRPSVGRLGSSILEGVGHPEWIARTEEEYIEKAVALATDLPKLAALRVTLRDEMKASALMDEAGFARKVEAAYQAMWIAWCMK